MAGAYIDLAGWKHREHFEFFRGFAQPFFSVCVDVDVTRIWEQSRQAGGPPFLMATLFAALQAANVIEPMRLRIREAGVWRHDRVGISTTVLRGDETFGYARFDYQDDLPGFVTSAERTIGEVRAGHGLPVPDGDDVIYHSTLPWLRFTAFSNALPLRDSVPRFVFGKCVPDGGRMVMPVAVEVHHAVVHGLDVARFFERCQERLDLAE
jgi:chloramphenicol O-acetyltransferase type A